MSHVGSVLLVEDHLDIAEMVGDYLRTQGYDVDFAHDGPTGLKLGNNNQYDAIVLDVMLPGQDGLSVCKAFRETHHLDAPIIMLTARDTLSDKLAGFESGADDYLVKPFDVEELSARIGVLIRRQQKLPKEQSLVVGDLRLDLKSMRVDRGDQEIVLTPIGMQILQLLMQHSPNVVHRRDVEREIWGGLPPDSDALRSHMYNLRKAVDKPFQKKLIHTVHNTGFRLIDESGLS